VASVDDCNYPAATEITSTSVLDIPPFSFSLTEFSCFVLWLLSREIKFTEVSECVRTQNSFEPRPTLHHMADPMIGQLICKEESDQRKKQEHSSSFVYSSAFLSVL
jgi:hypothetical protein